MVYYPYTFVYLARAVAFVVITLVLRGFLNSCSFFSYRFGIEAPLATHENGTIVCFVIGSFFKMVRYWLCMSLTRARIENAC